MSSLGAEAFASLRRAVLRGSFWSLVTKGAGAAAAFVMQVVIARALGIDEYGVAAYALAWVSILAVVSALGLDKAALRFVAEYRATGRTDLAQAYVAWSTRVIAAVSVAVGLVLVGVVFGTSWSDERGFAAVMSVSSLLIPFLAVSQLYAEAIRAQRRVILSELPGMVGRPALTAVIVAAAAGAGYSLSAVMVMGVSVATAGLSLLLLALLSRSIASESSAAPTVQPVSLIRGEWLAVSIPLLLVTTSNFVLARTDILMLGSMASTTAAGAYNASSRLASLVGFPEMGVVSILAPMMAQLMAQGRKVELQRLVSFAAGMTFAVSMLAALACMFFVYPLLGLFGAGFESEVSTVRVLVVGQALCALAGPAGYVLAMTGGQGLLAMTTASSAALNVLLNLALIPSYGTTGAAVATAISLTAHNVANAIVAVRRVGVNPSFIPVPNGWFKDRAK